MAELISLSEARKRRSSKPVPTFDRVMEKLFDAIDLIDEGAAREAVCDACDLLLRREEGMLAWPKR